MSFLSYIVIFDSYATLPGGYKHQPTIAITSSSLGPRSTHGSTVPAATDGRKGGENTAHGEDLKRGATDAEGKMIRRKFVGDLNI